MDREPLRVMIVDDHMMVHIGLAGMMEVCDSLELVGEAISGEEAIQQMGKVNPDVILMDLAMPGMGGIEATRLIKQSHPDVQILVLTSYEDSENIEKALSAGAVGYLLKNVTAGELERAIISGYEGRVTLAPEAAKALVEKSKVPPLPHDPLTERELEVLAYVARGMSNARIAEKLVVSPFTIKAHVSNILSKLDVSTRAEAAAYAVHHNLVDL